MSYQYIPLINGPRYGILAGPGPRTSAARFLTLEEAKQEARDERRAA